MRTAGIRSVVATLAVSALSVFSVAGNAPARERQSGKPHGTGKDMPVITLTQPSGGWTVDQMVTVAGTVSDPTIDPVTISINGDRYLVRAASGQFSRRFPVVPGKNSIIVQGSNAAGTAKAERAVQAEISPGVIFLVLTSDTDGIYTDLHVYEPLAGLKDPVEDSASQQAHVYWADTSSPSGGKFYLNEQGGSYDEPGYGPYLYTHTAPPLGIYRVDANYWPSGDKAHAVATLNVVLFGGTNLEQKRVVRMPLVMPGETSTLAWIRIDKHQQGYVYVPSIDPMPTDTKIWPKWVLDYQTRKMDSDSGI